MTKIINIKSGEPYDIYIGRKNLYYNEPEDSIFANPFIIGKDGTREEVIQKFREYAINNEKIMSNLHLIDGKILACYCVPDFACHGETLIELREKQKKEQNIIHVSRNSGKTETINNIINNKKYKLAVIGSRSIQDKKIVYDYLNSKYDKIEMIISGGASGPDSFAADWAHEKGFTCLIYNARWHDRDGNLDRGAGYRRNHDIIKSCDICVSFWDGKSKGTLNSMELCKKYDKKLIIIKVEPNKIDNIEEKALPLDKFY